jgi:hypothetical protein
MYTNPMIRERERMQLATLVGLLFAPLRAAAYIVGALIGSIIGGFVQAWKDVA